VNEDEEDYGPAEKEPLIIMIPVISIWDKLKQLFGGKREED
jgi:hypothetical protein